MTQRRQESHAVEKLTHREPRKMKHDAISRYVSSASKDLVQRDIPPVGSLCPAKIAAAVLIGRVGSESAARIARFEQDVNKSVKQPLRPFPGLTVPRQTAGPSLRCDRFSFGSGFSGGRQLVPPRWYRLPARESGPAGSHAPTARRAGRRCGRPGHCRRRARIPSPPPCDRG